MKRHKQLFWDIHKDLPRQGPGDNAFTKQAYQMMANLASQPRILDIACGPGMQTIELARISNGQITAIDNHQPFLDELNERSQIAGQSERIEILNQSMFSLYLPMQSFDIVWSEGAIYIIGFRKGLLEWRDLLKPLGFIVVTECSWLKHNPPKECGKFWDMEYPGMNSITNNLKIIQDSDYREIGHFVLPESAWWEHYYNPLIKRVNMFKEQYASDSETLLKLDSELEEIEIFQKYHDYYSYVFYIMQRTD